MGRAADSPLDARLCQVARRLAWQRSADRFAVGLPAIGAAVLIGSSVLPICWPLMNGLQFAWTVGGLLLAFVFA